VSLPFCPRGGRRDVPPSADGASPAEVQRKTPRPERANPLTQFVCPGQPVEKRSRHVRANTLMQFACPGQPVQKTSLVFKLNCFSDNATAKRHTQAETA